MLTREQARKQPCRNHIESIEYDYHQNGEGVAHKIFHYHKCTANDCPKWVDCYDTFDNSPCHKDCGKWNDSREECNNCPHRYGRCGG